MTTAQMPLPAVPARVVLDAGALLRCRRRVHLEHDPAAFRPEAPADPGVEQRIADAEVHRRAVAEVLAPRLALEWTAVPAAASTADRELATLAALRAGTRFVWGAVLPADRETGRRGGAELLVRTADGGYRPVIVVRHKITDPGSGAWTTPLAQLDALAASPDPARKVRSQPRDALRLAHLHRMLVAAGVAAAGRALGGVVGLEADVVLWYDLDAASWVAGHSTLTEYDTRFADRLAVARAAASGQRPLAQASRVNECRNCPWWSTCEPELLARRDVSLVVRGEDAVALRVAGVRTVDDLAAADPAGEPPVQLGRPGFADAVVLARAWRRGLSVVRRVQRVEVPRGEVEVDVDMESFGESGAYLWGCWLSGVDVARAVGFEPGYRPFATWQPLRTGDEARSFAAFWCWLTTVRARAAARGLGFRAYCYNEQAENRWMLSSAQRFAGAPGVPKAAAVREFIRSGQWVDLYAVVDRQFLCAHGKGLKRVAPAAGFAWRDPAAGGENSMRWYRDAVGLDGATPDPTQRERLLTYNEDDVRATFTLRNWMSSAAVLDVPHAADLA